MKYALVLALSSCATQTSLLAREGVMVGLPSASTEEAVSTVLKSRGQPIVARDSAGGQVRLKFKGPTAAVYAQVVPATGDQSVLKLYGTSMESLDGTDAPGSLVETARETPPDWVRAWVAGKRAYPYQSDPVGTGDEAVSGALIELQQNGVAMSGAASPPPLTMTTVPTALCSAEQDPAWVDASARLKAELLARCHPDY